MLGGRKRSLLESERKGIWHCISFGSACTPPGQLVGELQYHIVETSQQSTCLPFYILLRCHDFIILRDDHLGRWLSMGPHHPFLYRRRNFQKNTSSKKYNCISSQYQRKAYIFPATDFIALTIRQCGLPLSGGDQSLIAAAMGIVIVMVNIINVTYQIDH